MKRQPPDAQALHNEGCAYLYGEDAARDPVRAAGQGHEAARK